MLKNYQTFFSGKPSVEFDLPPNQRMLAGVAFNGEVAHCAGPKPTTPSAHQNAPPCAPHPQSPSSPQGPCGPLTGHHRPATAGNPDRPASLCPVRGIVPRADHHAGASPCPRKRTKVTARPRSRKRKSPRSWPPPIPTRASRLISVATKRANRRKAAPFPSATRWWSGHAPDHPA